MLLDVSNICKMVGSDISNFVHNIIIVIKIAVPIILVIFGMLDFAKGVVASKEDEIKKGQHTFIKRLIGGACVFLMISLTQLVIGLVDKESDGQFWNCANAIMNGNAENYGEVDPIIYNNERDIMTTSSDVYSYCCQKLNEKYDPDGLNGHPFDGVNKCQYGTEEEMISCAEKVNQALKTNYFEVYKSCCTDRNYTYTDNGFCRDRQYEFSNNNMNQCAFEKIFKEENSYDNCCKSLGGNSTTKNGKRVCIYNGVGNYEISEGLVISCVVDSKLGNVME